MSRTEQRETITIPQAGQRMRCRYQRARDLVLCGELEGWQDARGRWLVDAASVDAWLARQAEREAGQAAGTRPAA